MINLIYLCYLVVSIRNITLDIVRQIGDLLLPAKGQFNAIIFRFTVESIGDADSNYLRQGVDSRCAEVGPFIIEPVNFSGETVQHFKFYSYVTFHIQFRLNSC